MEGEGGQAVQEDWRQREIVLRACAGAGAVVPRGRIHWRAGTGFNKNKFGSSFGLKNGSRNGLRFNFGSFTCPNYTYFGRFQVYRVVQLNFTPEIEVLYKLFETSRYIFSMPSVKQHN